MTRPGIYQYPELYQCAFSYRRIPREVDSLITWQTRHSDQLRTVLEVAAGPADHALEFARRGIEVHILDTERAMLEFASLSAASSNVQLATHCADMTSFSIPRRFDLAILMLDSMSHVHTLDAFIEHLQSVRRHLKKTGTYIIEMAHPSSFLGVGRTKPAWVVPATRLGKISVSWGTARHEFDNLSQIERVPVSIVATCGKKRSVVRQTISQRRWTYTEMNAAIRLSGAFTVAESHGNFDVNSSLDNRRSSWRMIYVLRPKSFLGESAHLRRRSQ